MNLPFKIDLSNKVIVITGAGGVLCSYFAKCLCSIGAKVALLDIDEKSIIEVENDIKVINGNAKAYKCDVLNKVSLKEVHTRILNDLGKCDILINGAGGNNPKATTDNEFFKNDDISNIKTFFDLDKEGIEFVFDLNYMGTLLPTQEFATDMINNKLSSIINISSMASYAPLTKIPAYSSAKAAVSNLTMWLAVHFAKVGIRCNAIAPGFFISKQNEKLLLKEDGTYTTRAQKIIQSTPLARFGEKEELIGTLLFLISYEASSFVNGVIIPIDGGFLAYSGV